MKKLRILAIDTLGPRGHININRTIFKTLGSFCEISFAASARYHKEFLFNFKKRIFLPDGPTTGTIKTRLSQWLILKKMFKKIKVKDYDALLFMSYETISLAFGGVPQDMPVYLIENNNIDELAKSKVKEYFYNKIPENVFHLSLMQYISRHVSEKYGKKSFDIPHPYYRSVKPKKFKKERGSGRLKTTRNTVFAPSLGNDLAALNGFKEMVQKTGKYLLIAKGAKEQGKGYLFKEYFSNYEEILISSDFVLFTGKYDFRITGCVFEALSYCKPVVMYGGRFAREIKDRYPNSIFIIRDEKDFGSISVNRKKLFRDHIRFLNDHKMDNLGKRFKYIFGKTIKMV